MKSVICLSTPGLIFSFVCCIPSIVYAAMKKGALPSICATHFGSNGIANGFMSSDGLFWFTILFPLGMVVFLDSLGLLCQLCPISAYSGIKSDYWGKGNRFNMLKAMMVNMFAIIAALLALFLFSIMEPTWEYNFKCVINPEKPVPCDYKMVVVPQVIVFLVAMFISMIGFIYLMTNEAKKDGVMDSTEDELWKCGVCYVNVDDERTCVPKRLGYGWTINAGNPCGIALTVLLVLIPIGTVGLLLLLL